MKRLLPALLVLAGANPVFSQTTSLPILCGNEVFSHMVREQYPGLQASFDAAFESAKQHSGSAATDRSPLTINVVVHIVWKNPAENLADDLIHGQIQVLNEDFNRLNTDTANLRPYFQSVAGKADIHFQLAEIVRTQTTEEFAVDIFSGNLLSELKHASQGGSDAWPTENYLNIWVCQIQPTTLFGIPIGQILGFAFPPADLPHWPADANAPSPEEDGVVIDYRVFGRNNPNPVEIPGGGGNLAVRGRTPVHEIGHYLGLRHIWGDGGLLGPNDCAQSDGVDDTPFASAQSSFDCDVSKNSCEQVEAFYNDDPLDLVENYMDYASEDCMNMFTAGQVAIMRGVLLGPRSGLLNPVSTQQPAGAGLGLSLVPNPAWNRVVLHLDRPEADEISVRIVGMDGRTNAIQNFRSAAAGSPRLELDIEQLPAGVYGVEVRTRTGVAVRKLQIVR